MSETTKIVSPSTRFKLHVPQRQGKDIRCNQNNRTRELRWLAATALARPWSLRVQLVSFHQESFLFAGSMRTLKVRATEHVSTMRFIAFCEKVIQNYRLTWQTFWRVCKPLELITIQSGPSRSLNWRQSFCHKHDCLLINRTVTSPLVVVNSDASHRQNLHNNAEKTSTYVPDHLVSSVLCLRHSICNVTTSSTYCSKHFIRLVT